jgi:transposase
MSLQWRLSREVPEDTVRLGRAILASSTVYRQIGDHFDDLFPYEDDFASMYEMTGRGAVSPLLLALVTVFQVLEKAPDRVAAEWVVSRIDWKYALHLPLTYTGFHFTELYQFRGRLLAHTEERIVFDHLVARLKALGLIKRRGKIRTDSTHILAVVERLSQLELVTESLRTALMAVTKIAASWVEQTIPAAFCETYRVRQSEYGLSNDEIREHLVQAGKDGFWFLRQLDQSAEASVRSLAEVEVLRTVLAQQFPNGKDGPPAAKRPNGKDIIESPHEPEARRGTKRDQSWIGFKGQVSESCDEDRPRLIMDLEPTEALDSDNPELPKIQSRLAAQETLPGEHYVDQGYMSGQHIVGSAAAGIDLVGEALANPHSAEGFRQTAFQIDEVKRQAVCPAGQTSRMWGNGVDENGASKTIEVRFDGPTCQACRFFAKGGCTSSKQGRSLGLHPHREVLEARRAEAKTEEYREKMHLRAGIEGTISELVRSHGMRRARYRGLKKLRVQCLFTAVAVNLKRLVRWWARAEQDSASGGHGVRYAATT